MAVVFLVVLFLLKIGILLKKSTETTQEKEESGLIYGAAVVEDLVNKDGDGDGVLDWEESLWGTNPTLKETTPGTPDKNAIEKLKRAQGITVEQGLPLLNEDGTEKLTETDKFSREFFSTVAALNQNGAMDEATAEKISNSLAERIQNVPPRKVFTLADIKISAKDDATTTKNYNETLNDIVDKKYPIKGSVSDILQRFVLDENNDSTILMELSPILEQKIKIIDAIVKTNTPEDISLLHLNFINGLERIVENLSDTKFYDTDPIVALGGISKYEKNITLLESAINELKNAIQKKLGIVE